MAAQIRCRHTVTNEITWLDPQALADVYASLGWVADPGLPDPPTALIIPTWIAPWNNTTDYPKNAYVSYNGSTYLATSTVLAGNAAPDANASWVLQAAAGASGSDPNAVKVTGAQSVAGVKTFTAAPTLQVGLNIGTDGSLLWPYPGAVSAKTWQLQDNLYVRKRLGIGGEPNARNPFLGTLTIDGSTLSSTAASSDKVGLQANATFKGGFSGESGFGAVDPGFIWGMDVFAQTGQTAGDSAGLTDFRGGEIEAHHYTPSANLNNVFGLQVDASLESTATNSVVSTLTGLYITAPKTPASGASYRTIYGVHLLTTAGLGTTATWGFYESGIAPNFLGGPLTLGDGSGSSGLLQARSLLLTNSTVTTTGQARLTLYQGSTGDIGAVFQKYPSGGNTLDLVRFQSSAGSVKSRIDTNLRYVTAVATVPVLADLSDGEVCLYVDPTTGHLAYAWRKAGAITQVVL